MPIRQKEVTTRGAQPVSKTAAKAADRIQTALADRIQTCLFIDRDILYGRSERERFAFLGFDVHIVDDKAVRLTEKGSFGSAHLDVAQCHVLNLHLRQAVEIDSAFEVGAFDVLNDNILECRRLFAYRRRLCVY